MLDRLWLAKLLFFTSAPMFMIGMAAGLGVFMAVMSRNQPVLAALLLGLAAAATSSIWLKERFFKFMFATNSIGSGLDAEKLRPGRAQLINDAVVVVAGAAALLYLRAPHFSRWLIIVIATLFAMHVTGSFMLRREARK
jgi:intracellular septation protein A